MPFQVFVMNGMIVSADIPEDLSTLNVGDPVTCLDEKGRLVEACVGSVEHNLNELQYTVSITLAGRTLPPTCWQRILKAT